ncbi:MAG TPA: hypothetical protein VF796_22440, partial [Humisphaera sp.]
LGLPLWIPAVNGTVTVRGRELSPDQDTGDTFSDVTAKLNFALALRVEAQKGRFGLLVDAMYADVSATRDTAADGEVELRTRALLGDAVAYYTLIAPPPGPQKFGTFRLDALGGARVTWLQLGLSARDFNVTQEHNIVDPIVGGRFELGLAEWLSLKARGDVGGFGISPGTTTQFSWNVDASLEFHLSDSVDLAIGYRWLHYNFGKGSGPAEFKFDTDMSGPTVALTVRF